MTAGPAWLLLTCEHGGHRVPPVFARVFAGAERALRSHAGWDPGALWLARRLARGLRAPLVASTTTRLLVDLNRSLHHPRVFSRHTRALDAEARQAIVRRHYRPYRRDVERRVAARADRGRRVVHVAVHSFSPRLRGHVRRVDVGLLYDPARAGECALAARWGAALREQAPELRVRRNQPYRGAADGLTTHLRGRFGPRRYLGLELEVSQRLLARTGPRRAALARVLEASLRRALDPGQRLRCSGGTQRSPVGPV